MLLMNNIKLSALASISFLVFSFPLIAASQTSGSADAYGNAKSINSHLNELSSMPDSSGKLELTQAKALDECGNYMVNPNFAVIETQNLRTNGGKYADFRIAALKQQEARCKDFALGSKLKTNDSRDLYAKAEEKGSAEALAHNLAWGLKIKRIPPAQEKSKTLEVINSGDPAALFELATVFGNNGPFLPTAGHEVGASTSIYAWQLVACDHGLNCSSSSPVAQQACLGLGICGPGDFRANLQYSGVAPGTYKEIVQIEGRINNAISNKTIQDYIGFNSSANSP